MRFVMSVVFASAVASACGVESGIEPQLSTSTQGVLEENKITSNKITSNRIELNKITSNKITSNKITSNSYKITSNHLLDTAEGRELLTYLVACAIPSDVTLQADVGGVHYVFAGEIGLAPRWLDRALRLTDQHWVSACLLSRVNRFGVSVPISIRGPHDSLTVTRDEAATYTLEEGAFYGNIFTPVDEPIIWFSCRGRDEAVRESGALDLRDCAEKDPADPAHSLCGFDYVGDCSDWAPPRTPYACKRFKELDDGGCDRHDHDGDDQVLGSYYEDCFDEAGNGRWPHAEKFAEVITVFVKP
jgi:hypothetical protein